MLVVYCPMRALRRSASIARPFRTCIRSDLGSKGHLYDNDSSKALVLWVMQSKGPVRYAYGSAERLRAS